MTVMLCTLTALAALALTICAWLDHILTPLITSHVLGLSAGFRTGIRIGTHGRHHRQGNVIQLHGRGRQLAGTGSGHGDQDAPG
jgi:hypothetical protein